MESLTWRQPATWKRFGVVLVATGRTHAGSTYLRAATTQGVLPLIGVVLGVIAIVG